MQTRILLPEPDDWTEGIPYRIVCAFFENRISINKMLDWYYRHAHKFSSRMTAYDCLREFKVYMPREKKSNGRATNNGGNNGSGSGSDAKWVWGNCKLSNEDIANLEGDESTLDYLVTCLVSLGHDGFGFSCKPVDKGESHCCTVFRPDFPAAGITIGVSAFGGDLRDAILTCLYKLDTYGGGDFSAFDVTTKTGGAKPRFR